MPKNKQKFFSDVTKAKHFLLGAGLVLTLIASTSFAQTVLPSGEVMLPCAPGEMPSPGHACAPGGAIPTNLQSGPTTGTTQTAVPQQPIQPTPPSQPSGGQPPFSAQAIEGAIASGQLSADTPIPCPPLSNQLAKASDCLNAAKGQTSAVQKPSAEEKTSSVNKSKLSPAKNPATTLAKQGLKNIDKLLNTLSKKINKEKTKTKKLAVVRSVARDFMKLCTKYGPKEQDEEFGDEESFTCDEFVAEISEPIASALKSKDANLAFELTYDALNVNFKELFNSLIIFHE